MTQQQQTIPIPGEVWRRGNSYRLVVQVDRPDEPDRFRVHWRKVGRTLGKSRVSHGPGAWREWASRAQLNRVMALPHQANPQPAAEDPTLAEVSGVQYAALATAFAALRFVEWRGVERARDDGLIEACPACGGVAPKNKARAGLLRVGHENGCTLSHAIALARAALTPNKDTP